jgi:hypothetical protein
MSKYQKKVNYDAIVFTSTFLDLITSEKYGTETQSKFNFLKESTAMKLAFPQDDYWISEVRDQWYCEMNVNIVFPVCQESLWKSLYPQFSTYGKLMQGYTGYIHPRHHQTYANRRIFAERKLDVVYRAAAKPLFPNYLGYLKGRLGHNFESLCKSSGSKLKLDVTGKPKIRNHWEKLLSNSKCVLGSPSGSSTLVANHEISGILGSLRNLSEMNVVTELRKVLPEKFLNVNYTAISPRNIEAASTGTVQVLVEGDYGNLLKANNDYITFDFTKHSLETLSETLADYKKMEEIAVSCWKSLSENSGLNAERHVQIIVKLINSFQKNNSYANSVNRSSRYILSREISRLKNIKLIIQDNLSSYYIFCLKFIKVKRI